MSAVRMGQACFAFHFHYLTLRPQITGSPSNSSFSYQLLLTYTFTLVVVCMITVAENCKLYKSLQLTGSYPYDVQSEKSGRSGLTDK